MEPPEIGSLTITESNVVLVDNNYVINDNYIKNSGETSKNQDPSANQQTTTSSPIKLNSSVLLECNDDDDDDNVVATVAQKDSSINIGDVKNQEKNNDQDDKGTNNSQFYQFIQFEQIKDQVHQQHQLHHQHDIIQEIKSDQVMKVDEEVEPEQLENEKFVNVDMIDNGSTRDSLIDSMGVKYEPIDINKIKQFNRVRNNKLVKVQIDHDEIKDTVITPNATIKVVIPDNNDDSDNTTTTTTTTTEEIQQKEEEEEEKEKEKEKEILEEKKEEDFVVFHVSEPHTGLIMYDHYGFLVDQDLVQTHIIFKDKFQRSEENRKSMWLDFIESNPGAFQELSIKDTSSPLQRNNNQPTTSSSPTASPPSSKQQRSQSGGRIQTFIYRLPYPPKPLKQMIRKGVPEEFRSIIWLRCSGAYTRLSQSPDEYFNILKIYKNQTSVATKQILMDVDRTFPEHKNCNTPQMLEKLTNVLTAYSWRNPKVGYCQCMNFIAGFLLLFMSENEAYWTLVSIIEDLMPSEYYSTTMIDLSVDVRFVFDDLLQKKLPKLHKHFTNFGLQTPLIISQWFLCLMATTCPTETTFRIWDCFFSEGSKVLFRFAIAFFYINEEKLLTCHDYTTLYNLIRKIPSHIYDADYLIDVAFNKLGSFPMSKINQKRKECKIIVTNEYLNFQKLRNRDSTKIPANNTNNTNNNEDDKKSKRYSVQVPPKTTNSKSSTFNEA